MTVFDVVLYLSVAFVIMATQYLSSFLCVSTKGMRMRCNIGVSIYSSSKIKTKITSSLQFQVSENVPVLRTVINVLPEQYCSRHMKYHLTSVGGIALICKKARTDC